MMGESSSSSTSLLPGALGTRMIEESFPHGLSAGMCVGPWRILRWLGQGGYGVVYLAEDTRLASAGSAKRLVALKFAVGRTKVEDPQARQRLLREGNILSQVVHPHVVRCLGQGELHDVPYLVLEYIPGSDLYDWSALRNRTAREVMGLVGTLARTLRAVHGAGVLHRDLKCANVLVREPDGQPVLLDFGVGDYEGASTLTGTVLPPGTAHYRSAQAVRFLLDDKNPPCARYHFTIADELYALGVILYRLLTDEYPFAPELPQPILYERIGEEEPTAPMLLNPRVPRSASDLAMRLLSKRPEERGASAAEVEEAIQRALSDGDGQWDGFLFDWDDGPSGHSRTTEETDTLGPIAPGHEVALMHAAAQRREYRWAQRKKKGLRKRPRLSVPTAPAPSASSKPDPGRLGRRAVWGLLAIACLTGLVWSTREMALSRAASQVSPTKDGQPVNTEKVRSARLQEEQAVQSTTVKQEGHLLEMCAAATAAGLVLSACAGVPARPPERECPSAARKAMNALDVTLDDETVLVLDVNRPGGMADVGTFQDGPVVSVLHEGFHLMPRGTLVYGRLWVRGERIIGHYDRAKLPGGEVIPVCFAIGSGYEQRPGIPKLWGTKAPGTVEISREVPIMVVRRFESE
ncbi:serine/threonine protein kinase [Archangium violaceum]|nr:serine/threonine protein kinase [Archangium violaceum]